MTSRLSFRCVGPTKRTLAACFSGQDPLLDGLLPGVFRPVRPSRASLLVCAPSLVAHQSAGRLGYNAVDEPQLRDLDVGRWAGRSIGEVANEEPAGVASWLKDPDCTAHGGESICQLLDRIGSWMRSQLDSNSSTLAVTHPAVIRAAIVHAVGAPAAAFWRFDIAPFSVTTFRGNVGRWNLVELARLTSDDDGPSSERDDST